MSAHARLQRKKSRDAEHEHVPVFAAEPIATQRALPALQPKLTISQPGDMYEQEAERVADQVLRMPDPAIQRSANDDEPEEEPLLVSPADQQPIQRAATPDEIEAAQPLAQPAEDDELVQLAADGALAAAPAEARITALQGGQPLDAATRAFMEPRFGHDFSQVRVYTSAEAAAAARSVNALAYTLGSDVVFGAGQYQPQSDAGRRLMAHELTHVVQQSFSTPPLVITNHTSSQLVGTTIARKPEEQIQRAGPAAGAVIGTALSAVGLIQGSVGDTKGGLTYSSDQLTYPRDIKNIQGASTKVKRVAKFLSFGTFSNNDTTFCVHGDFGSQVDEQGDTTPVLANVYIDLDDTTTYYSSSLSFNARGLQTPYGTAEDPKLRFVCTGRFDPAGMGDCSYQVIIEIDKYGSANCIGKPRLTNGEGDISDLSPAGFILIVGR